MCRICCFPLAVEAMRVAEGILQGSTRAAIVVEPLPPVFVPVPAPEMWQVHEPAQGLRCWHCATAVMARHWLTRWNQRICLACKESRGVHRGRAQFSQAECLRAVDDRLAGLTQDELSVLKTYGDSLHGSVWEDALGGLPIGGAKTGSDISG